MENLYKEQLVYWILFPNLFIQTPLFLAEYGGLFPGEDKPGKSWQI